MTLSGELDALAKALGGYCQFLEDELDNIRGIKRSLERLAAKARQQETAQPKGAGHGEKAAGSSVSDPAPSISEKSGGNRCNYPIF